MKWLCNIPLVIALIVAGSTAATGMPLPDTVKLYFQLDVAELSDASSTTLDSLVYYDVLTPDKALFIIGYADNLGTDEYNLTLSEKRAKNVQAYLSGLGIRKTGVKMCTGKGEVKRDKEITGGYRQDRRVDIVTADKPPRLAIVPKPKLTVDANVDTVLTGIQVGQTLVLRNIYFHAGRHVVKDESMPQLQKLYTTLVTHPRLKIAIEGHVCCVPSFTDALDEDTFEQALSLNRARFIYDYLIEKGIDQERLMYKGFGRTRPVVVIEKTMEDEDANRRVEIRVLEN